MTAPATTTAVWPTEEVEEHLAAVGRDVRRRMLDTIPDGEPHRWLYRVTREYPSRAGKALRPALCLAACEAFGGDREAAMPVAVSIELLHNAFLVHDDIVDGSLRRRGRPTLSAEYGDGLALNAGDALAVLANETLRAYTRRLPSDLADRVHEEFSTMAMRTLEGQATELGWRRDRVIDLTPDDYLDLIMHKTCWYTTIHPLRVGTVLGAARREDLRAMVRFGFYLGAAFQIRDDLLNLSGDETAYGKELCGDLYEGKRTLPLIHLASNARGADHETVAHYLALDRDGRDDALVAKIRELMDAYGSIAFAAEYAGGIASAATSAFDDAFGARSPGSGKTFLRSLIPYMLGRRS